MNEALRAGHVMFGVKILFLAAFFTEQKNKSSQMIRLFETVLPVAAYAALIAWCCLVWKDASDGLKRALIAFLAAAVGYHLVEYWGLDVVLKRRLIDFLRAVWRH